MATPRQSRDLVAALDGEVHVVLVLRDYVRQFPAVWQEALKMNTELSVDDYMDQVLDHQVRGAWGWRSQDVPRVLRRWSKAVPPERLHVITVPPPGAPRHLLWERWTEVLGIDTTDFDMDTARPNESLGAPQAALMQRLKPHLTGPLLEGPERHRWVRAYFAHEVLVPQKGPRLGLREDHREALEAASGRAIRAVRRGGYPVAGELTDLRPVLEPGLTRPADVPDAELVEVAALAIERMIRDVRELTLKRDAAPARPNSGGAPARDASPDAAPRRRTAGALDERPGPPARTAPRRPVAHGRRRPGPRDDLRRTVQRPARLVPAALPRHDAPRRPAHRRLAEGAAEPPPRGGDVTLRTHVDGRTVTSGHHVFAGDASRRSA